MTESQMNDPKEIGRATRAEPKTLCMDVIAESWSRDNPGRTAKEFTDGLKKQFNLPAGANDLADQKYMEMLEQDEIIKTHSTAAAKKLLDDAKETWQCK